MTQTDSDRLRIIVYRLKLTWKYKLLLFLNHTWEDNNNLNMFSFLATPTKDILQHFWCIAYIVASHIMWDRALRDALEYSYVCASASPSSIVHHIDS